jgi:hypothetical protein
MESWPRIVFVRRMVSIFALNDTYIYFTDLNISFYLVRVFLLIDFSPPHHK